MTEALAFHFNFCQIVGIVTIFVNNFTVVNVINEFTISRLLPRFLFASPLLSVVSKLGLAMRPLLSLCVSMRMYVCVLSYTCVHVRVCRHVYIACVRLCFSPGLWRVPLCLAPTASCPPASPGEWTTGQWTAAAGTARWVCCHTWHTLNNEWVTNWQPKLKVLPVTEDSTHFIKEEMKGKKDL